MTSRKRTQHYDVVVVGAGIIGASFALRLAQQSELTVAVIDRGSISLMPSVPNLRATALGLQAQRLLDDCGVWPQLAATQCCGYSAMTVWDENSDGMLQFSAADTGAIQLGYIVDHFALQSLLQQELSKQTNVTSFYQHELQGVTLAEARSDTATQLQITSVLNSDSNPGSASDKGRDIALTAGLVVAADGVQSVVRQLAGIETRSMDYQQTGIVAVIRTQKSHENTAWQRFLSSGPLALLPLSNGDCSIVWSADNDLADELMALSDEAFSARLQAALQGRLGAVELCSQRRIFPLASHRARRYLQDNLVLVGDAAHGIHPLAGQGANLGFADIVLLLEQLIGDLDKFNQRGFSPLVLRRYERQRKLDNYAMDAAMTALYKSFRQTSSPLLSAVRGIGMNSINQSNQLKRVLAGKAIGLP